MLKSATMKNTLRRGTHSLTLALIARSDPGGRLADVGRHAGPQHGLEHEGAADDLGRQDEEEREVGRRARLAGLRQSRSSRTASCWSAPTTKAMRDPNVKGDKGVLMAFRESDGQFLWQAVHDKLAAGRANDWPYQGVCSSPLVENGTAYYVSNRGELMAVDIDGFRDGTNDGLVKDEKLTRETDVDVIWRYDMMEELGVLQHNMANSSPVMFENLIFVSTSNGQDESHVNIPSPKAPAIIAVDKTTGKLVWEDNSVGEKILHGQWSSPAVGKIGDTVQVVIGQGDGWVRGYEAKTGKKLWEFDLNPKDSVWPKTRNEVISTPVILRERRLHRQRPGPRARRRRRPPLRDRPTKRGDITETGTLWHYDKIRRSISTGRDLQRHPVLLGLQRLPARARRQDRQAVLDARHVRGDLGIADGHRRQGLSRRRGRRRRRARRRPDAEGDRREQHGQLGLLDAGAGQRHALHRQPQPAVRAAPKAQTDRK